jgi:hypothetical protein
MVYAADMTPLKCNYCGCVWDRVNPAIHMPQNGPQSHTDAEWEQWRIGQNIPDGQIYPRWSPAS